MVLFNHDYIEIESEFYFKYQVLKYLKLNAYLKNNKMLKHFKHFKSWNLSLKCLKIIKCNKLKIDKH